MNKKILGLMFILIVIICGLNIYFNYNNSNDVVNTNNHTSNYESIELKGEKTTINGLSTMIPDRYANGTIRPSPGIETYGKYDDDIIYVTVFDNSPQGNKVYQGDIDYFAYGIANKDNNPKRENITIANHTILYVTQHSNTRGDYRLAFFEVNGKKVLIEWLGNEITPDIKNIIYGFYKLN